MDSGNSGSMQSSSGGDEEYDSRGDESISNFLNHQSGHHFDPIISSSSSSNLVQPQILFHNSQNNIIPSDATTFSVQLLANLGNNNDLVWPGRAGLRSEPGCGYGNFPNFGDAHQGGGNIVADHHHHQQGPSMQPSVEISSNNNKNPKKRTRASRRAPTTVLTTDTTNFRQMVQEFTGIPAAPFSAVSSPYSRRLDLLSAAGAGGMRSSPHLDGLGPLYPLRPSAQKVQMSPMLDSLMPNAPTINVSGSNSSSINNQGPMNLFNIQQFHPLLQSSIIKNNINPLDNNGRPDDALGIMNNNEQVMSANHGGFHTQHGINIDGGNNYKPNCSNSSTSEFHPEKGLENVP